MKKNVLIFILEVFALTAFSQIQNVYDVTKKENAYIYQDKFVKLFMEDEIYLQVVSVNDTLKQFVVVPKIKDEANTITITFRMEDFGGKKSSILRTKNPFEKYLIFKAKISTAKRPEYTETSIVPIYPKILSNEQWPYRIESIILYDFKLK